MVMGGTGVAYYLAKSEPQVYSIADLEKDGKTVWDGVRNPQAVQAIRQMKAGDIVIIYHSGGESAVVGWAKVTLAGRPDPKDPKSAVMDLAFGGKLEPPTSLKEIKAEPQFAGFALVRQSRLSTMACPAEFITWLKKRYPKAGF